MIRIWQLMEVSVPGAEPARTDPGILQFPRWSIDDICVMPGTLGSISLRIIQVAAAIVSFSVMISASDFSTVTAFWAPGSPFGQTATDNFLVATTVLQCMWSLSVAAVEVYSWLFGRSLKYSPLLNIFVIGDWITAIVTFAGACASAGIAVLVGRDIHGACTANFCGRYALAAGMALLTWILIFTSFLFTFWILATR
eukprot:c19223_g1_i1 orf=271-861(+)